MAPPEPLVRLPSISPKDKPGVVIIVANRIGDCVPAEDEPTTAVANTGVNVGSVVGEVAARLGPEVGD